MGPRPLHRAASCEGKQGQGGSGAHPKLQNFPQEPSASPRAGSCRGSGAFLVHLVQALLAVARPGGPLGRCRAVARPRWPSGILQRGCCEAGGAPEECPVPRERCWQLETSLCQVTISARNDVPRGGSSSGRLLTGPPPPPLPRPPPRPAGSAGSVPSGTCWSPTCPASGTSQLSPRDGGDRTGPDGARDGGFKHPPRRRGGCRREAPACHTSTAQVTTQHWDRDMGRFWTAATPGLVPGGPGEAPGQRAKHRRRCSHGDSPGRGVAAGVCVTGV